MQLVLYINTVAYCLFVYQSEAGEISGMECHMAVLLSSVEIALLVGLHNPLFKSLTQTQSGELSMCFFLI